MELYLIPIRSIAAAHLHQHFRPPQPIRRPIPPQRATPRRIPRPQPNTPTPNSTVARTFTPTATGTPLLTFSDVPYDYSTTLGGVTYLLHDYIQALYDAGYTAGCLTDPLRYCPDNTMTRAESSVFMLRGQYGSSYAAPPAPLDRFGDDWSPGPWAEKWAEGMWNAGLTAGCWTDPLLYCPWDQFPRVQAAVFGLKMKYGNSYVPFPATGVFAEMTDTSFWGTKWAEQAYADGLLPACGTSGEQPLFCPNDLVTRAWGAYMIVKVKNLPLSRP